MVMQFRCWDRLPKCHGQILLLQTLGIRLFPTGIRSMECQSSQPCVVLFAACHKQGKWKYYSDYKALTTVPCSCFGRSEQKCHLDFDGAKINQELALLMLNFLAWLPTPRICKCELNPSKHKCKRQNFSPPWTAVCIRDKRLEERRRSTPWYNYKP